MSRPTLSLAFLKLFGKMKDLRSNLLSCKEWNTTSLVVSGSRRLIKFYLNPFNYTYPTGRVEYIKTGIALLFFLAASHMPLVVTAGFEFKIVNPTFHDAIGYAILSLVFIYTPLCLVSLSARRIKSTSAKPLFLVFVQLIWFVPYLVTNYMRSSGHEMPEGLVYSLLLAIVSNILYASLAP
jgi:hypothetical protein